MKFKRILGRTALLFVTVVALELLLRCVGYYPLGGSRFQDSPLTHEGDAVRGWKPKPGSFRLSAVDQPEHQETVWKGGSRATGREDTRHRGAKRPWLVFLGCSYIYGFGLSDDETLPWIVQENASPLQVVNHGVGGYGTYQSLLVMEQFSRTPSRRPLRFLYGFSDFHEERNVADPQNLREWARGGSGDIRVPYCVVNEKGTLDRILPEGYPLLPLRNYSSLVTLMEDVYVTVRGQPRLKQKREVTEKLLLEMRDVAKRNGFDFVVFMQDFQAKNREHYLSFFKQNEIEVIDGFRANGNSPNMRLPDGHPNASMNRYWAGLVTKYLAKHPAPTNAGAAEM